MAILPNQILPPGTKVLDDTGNFTKDWWLFFYNLFINTLGAGGNAAVLANALLLSDTDIPAADIAAVLKRVENLEKSIRDDPVVPMSDQALLAAYNNDDALNVTINNGGGGGGGPTGPAGGALTGNYPNPGLAPLVAAQIPPIRYDVSSFYPGIPAGGESILGWVAVRPTVLSAGAPLSRFRCKGAPSGNVTLTLFKTGVAIGTIFVPSGAHDGVFTVASPVTFAGGDDFDIPNISPPDPTMGNIRVTIADIA